MKTKYTIFEADTLEELNKTISSHAENEWYMVGPVQIAIAGGGMYGMVYKYVASMKAQYTP